MARALAITLTIGAALWVAALISAALLHGAGFLPAAVYGAASLICHQRPERSFVLAGAQFPVCARCAGLYFSGVLGALFAWVSFRSPTATADARRLLLIAAAPTLATIPIEWFGLSALSNAIRAVAAVPFGAASAWTFVRALRMEANERSGASASVAL
jgi:uncharacterized membrane protein